MAKYIGVDIGATSIKMGLFSAYGKLESKWKIKTTLENNGSNIVNNIVDSIYENLIAIRQGTDDIVGIGVGVPGPVNEETGCVIQAINLGWFNYPIKQKMEALLATPVIVGNDANLAALGEMECGSGLGVQNMVMFTIGSGVGGAIIHNGKIISGHNHSAGELGHLKINPANTIKCNCGGIGCLETTASANGIIKTAIGRINSGENSSLKNLINEHGKIDAEDIINCAKEGDALAVDIIATLCHEMALAMVNVACIFNPQKIIIGGGVALAGDYITEKIKNIFKQHCFPSTRETEINHAVLGNDAGIYGAMALSKQNSIKK